MLRMKTLLYSSSAERGGLALYAGAQAEALARRGLDVAFLCSPSRQGTAPRGCRILPVLPSEMPPERPCSRLRRRFATVRRILGHSRALVAQIRESGHRQVLFSAYSEYMAPLWAGALRNLARQGVVFGAVVHDPVRDAVVGPYWWHRWSIAESYSFLREAFVHEPVQLETVRNQSQLRTTVIPHGPYAAIPPTQTTAQMRARLNVPPRATVLLAFGHVRDNKNLDLALRALQTVPEVFLVVAGKELNASQRPVSYYQQMARQLGVADRCCWKDEFIPNSEIGNYFNAADYVLLAYGREFCSASGVLNVAVSYRKPCIVSAGPSNLMTMANQYKLGVCVEPGSVQALAQGILAAIAHPVLPEWERYEADNSWARNADLIFQRMFEDKAS
jgi:glycosyltransferase involved in cell wall biosynthesis